MTLDSATARSSRKRRLTLSDRLLSWKALAEREDSMLFNDFRIESVELSPNIVQTDELIVKTAKRWMRVTKALIIAPVKFRMTFCVFSQKENPKNYPSPRGKQRFARELWRRCILFVWKFSSRSIQTLRLVWDCFARELSTWRWRNSNYKKGKLFTFHPEIFEKHTK